MKLHRISPHFHTTLARPCAFLLWWPCHASKTLEILFEGGLAYFKSQTSELGLECKFGFRRFYLILWPRNRVDPSEICRNWSVYANLCPSKPSKFDLGCWHWQLFKRDKDSICPTWALKVSWQSKNRIKSCSPMQNYTIFLKFHLSWQPTKLHWSWLIIYRHRLVSRTPGSDYSVILSIHSSISLDFLGRGQKLGNLLRNIGIW